MFVNITYQTNGLGFAGGLSWNVTVSIQGMTHQFYFIDTVIKVLSKKNTGDRESSADPNVHDHANK
jgi:hypothetical protein